MSGYRIVPRWRNRRPMPTLRSFNGFKVRNNRKTGAGCRPGSDCRAPSNDEWRTPRIGYEIGLKRSGGECAADKAPRHQTNPAGPAAPCCRAGCAPPTAAHVFVYCLAQGTDT